jgi:uncharacterized protein YlzI (FlbEa/FlbD family)
MKRWLVCFLYIFWIVVTRPDGLKIWFNNESIVSVTKDPSNDKQTLIRTLNGDVRVSETPEEVMKQLNVNDNRYENK